jgi:hypothetical protein
LLAETVAVAVGISTGLLLLMVAAEQSNITTVTTMAAAAMVLAPAEQRQTPWKHHSR